MLGSLWLKHRGCSPNDFPKGFCCLLLCWPWVMDGRRTEQHEVLLHGEGGHALGVHDHVAPPKLGIHLQRRLFSVSIPIVLHGVTKEGMR